MLSGINISFVYHYYVRFTELFIMHVYVDNIELYALYSGWGSF